MNLTAFFALLGGLLVLAFIANRQFQRTRVPDVVVLMAIGLLLGPGLNLVEAAEFRTITEAFGTLALVLILFEGGLELNLSRTLRHFPGGTVLGLLSYGFTLALVSGVMHLSLGIPLRSAVLAAAVVSCTSASIVLPVLQQMKLREPPRVTLLIEASLGDVLAVLTVAVLLDALGTGGSLVSSLVGGFLGKMLISLVMALAAGVLWSRLLPALSEQRFWNVLTFAVVLLLYAGAEALDASGLIAALGFGLTLANFPGIKPEIVEAAVGMETMSEDHHQRVLTFHSELSFLVRTFFFVLLGVVVQFEGLRGYLLPMLGTMGALLLARWLAVKASKWSWREMKSHEQEIVLWMMPRGLITAVLAIQVFEGRGDEFAFLPTLTFAIILVTNLLVVFGAVRIGKHLKPVEPEPAEVLKIARQPKPALGPAPSPEADDGLADKD